MVFMVTLLVLGTLVLPLLLVLALRSWGMQEEALETSLLAAGAHTVAYVVPDGEDPTFVRAALSHHGFVSVLDHGGGHSGGHGGERRLVVRCEPGQREEVRGILQAADHPATYGDPARAVRVLFDDEPA